jgi:hypothetical protein
MTNKRRFALTQSGIPVIFLVFDPWIKMAFVVVRVAVCEIAKRLRYQRPRLGRASEVKMGCKDYLARSLPRAGCARSKFPEVLSGGA